MVQSPRSEAHTSAATHKIHPPPVILWNSKYRNRFHKSPPLSWAKLIQYIASYLTTIEPTVSAHLRLGLPSSFSLQIFPPKPCWNFSSASCMPNASPISSSWSDRPHICKQRTGFTQKSYDKWCQSVCNISVWIYGFKRMDPIIFLRFSLLVGRGSVRSTRGLGPTMTARGLGPTMTARGLGPTMTARGQSIGISIGMLPQTLIMSRLDQLSRLGARI